MQVEMEALGGKQIGKKCEIRFSCPTSFALRYQQSALDKYFDILKLNDSEMSKMEVWILRSCYIIIFHPTTHSLPSTVTLHHVSLQHGNVIN